MSNDSRFTLPLEERVDSDGRTYYIAKLKAPISIDCHNGICILIFNSIKDEAEIQIVSLTNHSPKEKSKDPQIFNKSYKNNDGKDER